MNQESSRIEAEKAAGQSRRLRRLALNKRLEDVAARIGVDPSQVHRWERGKAVPRHEHAEAWESALMDLERAS